MERLQEELHAAQQQHAQLQTDYDELQNEKQCAVQVHAELNETQKSEVWSAFNQGCI